MLAVTLTVIVCSSAVVVALVGVIRSQQRAHARREDLLVNQLLHAVGRDWQPAPAATERTEPVDREPRSWTPAPEQLPTD